MDESQLAASALTRKGEVQTFLTKSVPRLGAGREIIHLNSGLFLSSKYINFTFVYSGTSSSPN